ncbi:MAG: peptide chain release factor N(5)-glutamine methyltransferase [Chitinophagales bacterium]|jgi:release factor glutamine methyltransferase|nr:peptide chain release factor N(5)-glutamine methyltransferase [Sphingobacteriales bacterium]
MVLLSDNFSESEKRFLLQYIKKENPSIPLDEIISRLNLGEPIDYILGYTYFYGLKIEVSEDTLIPRPETEELVELILKENQTRSGLKILDIGTGSGCIALALKSKLGDAEVTAIDVSIAALEIAKKNSVHLDLKINFVQLDILDEQLWPQLVNYDIIVSNPPYIPQEEKKDMTSSVLDYEPHLALFVENDPLLFYKQILKFATSHLNPKGLVYFETSQTIQLEEYDGFHIEKQKDLSGNWRFLKCVSNF